MPKYRLVINIMILLGLLAGMHLVSGRLQRLTPPREAVLTTPANSSTSGDQSSEPPAREQNPAGSGVTGQALSGTVPGTNRSRLQPNELGKVMILEYHLIGDKEDRWERQYDNFRKDLERLYGEGYRLISLVDYLRNSIRVPEGYTPVVLTFDDGSRGQFNYLEKDGQKVIDPRSAVGIILDFAREHPDFGTAATFYTLYPPFGQARYWQEKVRFLVEHGMDIGNHTANHVNLAKLSAAEVAKEVGTPVKTIREVVPGYEVKTLALPYGLLPKDDAPVREGEFAGVPYRNLAILLVGAEPALSVNDSRFNPYRLPRVQAIQSELDRWLDYFARHPEERYVSDGDAGTITIPEKAQARLNPRAAAGKTVKTYR